MTINNKNTIYKDHQLGKLTGSSKQVTIRDLMKYAKKKSCGRLWMFIQWIFSGKGLITKETASTLLQRHPQRDKILEEFKILRTLVKTQAVAQPIIEKKEPLVNQLSVPQTTEQKIPEAITKKIEEQKIEKITPSNDISNVIVNAQNLEQNTLFDQKMQKDRLFNEYLRRGYNERVIREAIQVGMKVEEYAALENQELEENRVQARATLTSRQFEDRINQIEDSIKKISSDILMREASFKHSNEETMNPPSNSVKREEIETSSRLIREEPPKAPLSESEKKVPLEGVKHIELAPKIAVTSNEEMDLNEAYRIIGEALSILIELGPLNELTSGSPINKLRKLLES